jgi:hypothetical protein
MDGLTAAVYQRLVGSSVLQDVLTEFPEGSGIPAVFTAGRVPADAKLPYISTTGALWDSAWDTKTHVGRFVGRDIYLHVPSGQTATLEETTEHIRSMFHRDPLTFSGWRGVVARCELRTQNTDDYEARIVSLSLRLMEDDDESS